MFEVCSEVMAAELRAGLKEAICLIDGRDWPDVDTERKLLRAASTNELLSFLLERNASRLVCAGACTHKRVFIDFDRHGIVAYPKIGELDAKPPMLAWTKQQDITSFLREELTPRGFIQSQRQVYCCNRPNQKTLVQPSHTSAISTCAGALLGAASLRLKPLKGLGHSPALRVLNSGSNPSAARDQLLSSVLTFFEIQGNPLVDQSWVQKGDFRPNLLSVVATGSASEIREVVNKLGPRDAAGDDIRIALRTVEKREVVANAIRESYDSINSQTNARTFYEVTLQKEIAQMAIPFAEDGELIALREVYWTAASTNATWTLLSSFVQRQHLLDHPKDARAKRLVDEYQRRILRSMDEFDRPNLPSFMGQLTGPPQWFKPHGELVALSKQTRRTAKDKRGEGNRIFAATLLDHLDRLTERARDTLEKSVIGRPASDSSRHRGKA